MDSKRVPIRLRSNMAHGCHHLTWLAVGIHIEERSPKMKVALVTGGSKGIGLEAVLRLVIILLTMHHLKHWILVSSHTDLSIRPRKNF